MSSAAAPKTPLPARTYWRWALLATAAAAATILVGSALLMWGTIQRASRAAAQGQGEALLQACRLGLRGRGRPDAARMERVLKQKRDQGLRYIGVWTPGGRVVAEAGEALGSGVKTDGAIHFGDRVRLTRRQPPRGEGGRGGRGRGRPGMGRGRPGMGRGRPGMGMGPGGHPPPFLVIEFVPLTARSLQTQAKTLLAVVGGAVLAMVLLVVVAGRAMSGREALMAQLEQRRRLAELGEMSAVLAHELRNPLTSLKGHAQLLEEVLPEGKQQDKAGKVVGEAVRLERLLADLLTFVRTGEVQGRPVDPGELLRRAADEVDSARVALEVAPGLGRWQLDPERMNQALVNLLQNALQADEQGEVRAAARRRGEQLELTVTDRGQGIPAGKREAVFQPFTTGRARGTGLGLAITRRIVQLHGGQISAHDHAGGGAMIRILLPPAKPEE